MIQEIINSSSTRCLTLSSGNLDRQFSDKKKVGKGKYTYEKCKTWWYVCQQGGHDFAGDRSNAYMVCRGCEAHPGGGPDGSGPDGTYYTPSGGSGGSGSSSKGQEVERLWDAASNCYYYVNSNGASQ
jgi:hypothetical protein